MSALPCWYFVFIRSCKGIQNFWFSLVAYLSSFLFLCMSLVAKIKYAFTGCCCDGCISSYSSTFGQGTHLHICLSYQGRSSQSIGGICACQYELCLYYSMYSCPLFGLAILLNLNISDKDFVHPLILKQMSILRLETPTSQSNRIWLIEFIMGKQWLWFCKYPLLFICFLSD